MIRIQMVEVAQLHGDLCHQVGLVHKDIPVQIGCNVRLDICIPAQYAAVNKGRVGNAGFVPTAQILPFGQQVAFGAGELAVGGAAFRVAHHDIGFAHDGAVGAGRAADIVAAGIGIHLAAPQRRRIHAVVPQNRQQILGNVLEQLRVAFHNIAPEQQGLVRILGLDVLVDLQHIVQVQPAGILSVLCLFLDFKGLIAADIDDISGKIGQQIVEQALGQLQEPGSSGSRVEKFFS